MSTTVQLFALANLCNNSENTKDYEIKAGKAYYKGELIGEISGEWTPNDSGVLSYGVNFLPYEPLEYITVSITVKKT